MDFCITNVDRDKAEVTLRIGISCLLGFALATASLPHQIPPSFAPVLGVLVPYFAIGFPHLMLVFAGVIPSILMVLLFSCAAGSLVVMAAAVSRGCLVGVYAAYSLMITALFVTKHYSLTAKFTSPPSWL